MGVLERSRRATSGIAAGTVILLLASRSPAQISPGPLARAHSKLEGVKNCLKCHKIGSGPSAQKCLACHGEIAMRMKQNKGYHHLAVTLHKQKCFGCHSDHAGRDFQLIQWPGGRQQFNHSTTGWPLKGKHASTGCRKCHNKQFIRSNFSRFAHRVNVNTTFLGLHTSCRSCHFDEHRGTLGSDCEKCHTADAWKPAPLFDHSHSNFPLYGAHRKARCARCHPQVSDARAGDKDNQFMKFKRVAHDTCTRCHFDEHRGQLGAKCQRCHNQARWKPVVRFDHDTSRYPLTGRHRKIECVKCHKPVADPNRRDVDGRYLTFRPVAHKQCVDCHRDPHKNRFGQNCEKCHRTSAWKQIIRKNFDHSRTRFPLLGLHAKVDCTGCHKNGRKMTGLAFAHCSDCHADVHHGQFAKRKNKGACEACHDENGFKPARFTSQDHGKTRFPLRGAHLALPCIQCHKMIRPEKGKKKFMNFQFQSVACMQCHKDKHHGQFTNSRPRKSCDSCHSTDAWTPIVFDHDRDTTYPLRGEHQYVPCAKCHVPVGTKGNRFVRYRPLDHSCASCHTRTDLKLRSN